MRRQLVADKDTVRAPVALALVKVGGRVCPSLTACGRQASAGVGTPGFSQLPWERLRHWVGRGRGGAGRAWMEHPAASITASRSAPLLDPQPLPIPSPHHKGTLSTPPFLLQPPERTCLRAAALWLPPARFCCPCVQPALLRAPGSAERSGPHAALCRAAPRCAGAAPAARPRDAAGAAARAAERGQPA